MLKINRHGVLLDKTTLGFENEGVLNPATIQEGNTLHLFYRAVSKGNYSTIGYSKLSNALTIEDRHDLPVLFPQFDYESKGMEDPRITKIDSLYYLTYTAFDGLNAMGALATSKDLVIFEKQGLIVPQVTYEVFKHLAGSKHPLNEKYARYNDRGDMATVNPEKKLLLWDKNVIFFPRRINKKLYYLHRIKPDIQIAAVEELAELNASFWENYLQHFCDNIALVPHYEHEISYIGGGCPPIETALGWLLIYHGVKDSINGYVYSACAALMDIDNPLREIARLPYALFQPEKEWELKGEVNNVCFPSGFILQGDQMIFCKSRCSDCSSLRMASSDMPRTRSLTQPANDA